MEQKKEQYVSPQLELIHVENEGVIAASSNLPNVDDGGSGYNNARTYRNGSTTGYNGAYNSEIEDMINDILTVEQ